MQIKYDQQEFRGPFKYSIKSIAFRVGSTTWVWLLGQGQKVGMAFRVVWQSKGQHLGRILKKISNGLANL